MNTVAIVQARMTSTRLPGKVLKDIGGMAMLGLQLMRIRACRLVDEIVVATTTNTTDDPIVKLCRDEGIRYFRGSENDVLGRYVGAARDAAADVVIRITADCPLIDPIVTSRVIEELVQHSSECDYASNIIDRTYPQGLDVEAFFTDTLIRIERLALTLASREHVTLLAWFERPDLFLIRSIVDSDNNSDLRWTVDTKPDLEVVRRLSEGLGLTSRVATYREILTYAREHPEIVSINARVKTWSPTH